MKKKNFFDPDEPPLLNTNEFELLKFIWLLTSHEMPYLKRGLIHKTKIYKLKLCKHKINQAKKIVE